MDFVQHHMLKVGQTVVVIQSLSYSVAELMGSPDDVLQGALSMHPPESDISLSRGRRDVGREGTRPTDSLLLLSLCLDTF